LIGPFGNHLIAAAGRRDHGALVEALWCDPADIDQAGWLNLQQRSGLAVRPAVRYFMPGDRESHGTGLCFHFGFHITACTGCTRCTGRHSHGSVMGSD
jgi:hypothetical protein